MNLLHVHFEGDFILYYRLQSNKEGGQYFHSSRYCMSGPALPFYALSVFMAVTLVPVPCGAD